MLHVNITLFHKRHFSYCCIYALLQIIEDDITILRLGCLNWFAVVRGVLLAFRLPESLSTPGWRDTCIFLFWCLLAVNLSEGVGKDSIPKAVLGQDLTFKAKTRTDNSNSIRKVIPEIYPLISPLFCITTMQSVLKVPVMPTGKTNVCFQSTCTVTTRTAN